MDFPRLNDNEFPHINNVNVYKYLNEFDYMRYDSLQMKLQICSVPWDMGEAHIGNRTISGIGNVVYFETPEKRDKWFEAIPDSECFRFDSKYKALHRDHEITVEIPFDVCSKHNYLVVDYEPFAADGSPIKFEDGKGLMKWFWFIREVEFIAPNTTKLHLMIDAWQTFIYDVDIEGMILERGHAPLHASPINKYLSNPIGNSKYLLTDDVSFGDIADIAAHESEFVLNDGDMMAVIVTGANPKSNQWMFYPNGDAFTPAQMNIIDGTSGFYAFAVYASDFQTFINTINYGTPQFISTIKCVFFVSKKLITLGSSFKFNGDNAFPVTSYEITPTRVTNDLYSLNKADWQYPSEYANVTKLYTYPYSLIELYNNDGSIQQIRVENTSGKLEINTALNMAYPFIGVDADISGIGRAASKTLTFKNLTTKTIGIKGNWLDTLMRFEIPTFGVTQSSYDYDGYTNLYNRKQAETAYNNEYDNAVASANAAKLDADDLADNDVANMALNTANNTAITALANAKAADDADQNIAFNNAMNVHAQAMNTASSLVTINATQQSATLSATQGVIDGFLSGNIGNAISGLVNSGFTQSQAVVSNAATTAQAGLENGYNGNVNGMTNTNISTLLGYATQLETDKTTAINTMLTAQTTNSANTAKANATRDQTTTIANAGRNKSTAQNAIMRGRSSAGVLPPMEFGEFAAGEHATTRPNALYCVVKTQHPAAIAQAGDYFLRYGYKYDGAWSFDGNWNVMPKFTYWQLKDFWVKNLNIPDMYMDYLRFFLFGGVTVWRNPDDIGRVGIYQNGV